MTCVPRLNRVFAIEIEKCGGPVRIIAYIEEPNAIRNILKHLGLDQPGKYGDSPPIFEIGKLSPYFPVPVFPKLSPYFQALRPMR